MTTFASTPLARAACALALMAALGAQAQTVSVLPSVSTVDVGSSFSLAVQATGFAERIYGGGYNLAFDPSVLRLDSILIPASWEFAKSTGLLDSTGGTVSDVYFNTYVAPIAGDFLTATLNFTAIGGGSSTVAVSASGDFPFGDINGNAVNVAFNAATVNVTAVPEPGSLALMLTGLAAVGGLMRRRQQQDQG